MRKVVATVNGFEQETWFLTKTERETLGELGRLKNNLTSEYEFFFDGKQAETRADLPTNCKARFDTIIVQVNAVQEIVADTLVNVRAPKLTCRFLYTLEYEGKTRGVTVNVAYDCEKTALQNMEYAYERFGKVISDIVDRDFAFWGTKNERDEDRAD